MERHIGINSVLKSTVAITVLEWLKVTDSLECLKIFDLAGDSGWL